MRVLTGLVVFLCLSSLQMVSFAKDLVLPSSIECNDELSCALNSVVGIVPNWPVNFRRNEEPEGSGVVLGDGRLIATADHVLGPAKSVLVRTIQGELIDANIVLRDPSSDIALLKVRTNLAAIKISEDLNIGEKACAIGNGFGLNIALNCGVVSATNMSGTGFNKIEDFVQTDAAVNPGMSGGALVNSKGELIGVLSAIFTKGSDANIGVNFAVSSALLNRIVEDFLEIGMISRIQSGITVRPSLGQGRLGVKGALVVGLRDASPEAKAGLIKGDVILSLNDRRIQRAGAYEAALALLKKGNKVTIQILRDEKIINLIVEFE